MRILGIDPGTRLLGYAVVDVMPELRYVECGVVTAPAGRSLEARLAEIQRGLEEIIAEFRPDQVAVEDVFTAHNARSALALGHARGVALAAAGRAGLVVWAYAPAKVKRAVTGRGAAVKEQVALMVRALVGLRTVPRADAADALAVAVAHAHSQGARAGLRKGEVTRGAEAARRGPRPGRAYATTHAVIDTLTEDTDR